MRGIRLTRGAVMRWRALSAAMLMIALAGPTAAHAASVHTIETTFSSNNSQNGNMFDVTNVHTVPIELTGRFEGNMSSGSTTIEVWHRDGTFEGNESNPTGWTKLGEQFIASTAGLNNRTPFDVGQGVLIQPGQTLGMLIYSQNLNLQYTNGDDTFTDGNLQLDLGVGKGASGDEPPVTGTTFSPRIWNGSIEYAIVPSPAAAGAGLTLLGLVGLTRPRRRRPDGV